MAKVWKIIEDGRPATKQDVTKALTDELDQQMKELTPDERRELVTLLKRRDGEVGRDLGGGVAAVSVESACGETTRLGGKEAGDPMRKRKRPSFRNVLVDQQPTRNTTSLGYKRTH